MIVCGSGREPTAEAVEAMEVYLRTGGVPQAYLDRVLGPQDRAVCVTAQNSYDPEADRKAREFYDKLRSLPPAPWVVEMQKYHEEHGCYRAEHLRRLLGDPMKGVSWSKEGARQSLLGKMDCN